MRLRSTMAFDESQPSTPVRNVASEGLSSVSPSVVSSPASSSMSPDISTFLAQFRQAHSGDAVVQTLDSQMAHTRKERDDANVKANQVKKGFEQIEQPKGKVA